MHDGKARQSVDDPHVLLGYLAEDGVSVSPLVVRPGGDEEVGTSTNDARESPLDERGALPGQVRARADAEAALNEGVGRAGAAVVVDGAGLGHRLGAMELAASARLLTTRKVAEVRGSDGGEVLAEGDAHVALVGVQHQGSGGSAAASPESRGHGESHDLAHAPDMYAGFRSHSPMFAQRAHSSFVSTRSQPPRAMVLSLYPMNASSRSAAMATPAITISAAASARRREARRAI